MLKVAALLFLLSFYPIDVEAKCKVCVDNSHVCVGPDKYQRCTGLAAVGEIITCGAGLYCHQGGRCEALGTGQLPDCKCGYCNKNANNNFACISKTQRAKCTTANTATTQYSSCGTDQYCGVDNMDMNILCRNNPTGSANYKYACEDEPLPCTGIGRFPVENSGCKKYIICELIDGKYVKTDFECLGTTFFNPATSQCSSSYIC